jgi:chromosome segregation ATPase
MSDWQCIAEGRGIAMKSLSNEIAELERELQEARAEIKKCHDDIRSAAKSINIAYEQGYEDGKSELHEAKELLGYASKRLYKLAKTNDDYILVERINKRLESEAGDE